MGGGRGRGAVMSGVSMVGAVNMRRGVEMGREVERAAGVVSNPSVFMAARPDGIAGALADGEDGARGDDVT